MKSKKPQLGMADAFDWMGVKNVGDKAVNAEDQIALCDEEPAYRTKQDTHRERETHTHKEYNYIQEMLQLQHNNNNLYKGYKVTLYSD